ncbi:serine/threonine-protein kinase [Pseudonocardia sp. TRM90224]|uniref:serine/threonine-protein kinase n=1 Tax=Pseudonocardia sp. TRM90224 TaxID=2812678 RepID=UPI00272DE235|nr:serine/threonine-protein kinase [Pseudonocardia sp. TRM90224]
MPDAPGDSGTLVGGRYRLYDVLGEGGMGAVWRAADEVLGREVAIKRVRLGSLPAADAARARERTMREARIAAALHHPNVVTIFDIVIDSGEPWLILEYVPSRSLGAILREHGTLPPGEVAAIGAQIAAGLSAAHAAGVVHRDVKPDNVLIAGASQNPLDWTTAKLTDFGISRAAQSPDITAADILSGTPAYFAPEAARGEGTGPRTDMYSLGATLYAAVEGHPPFGGDQGNVLALLTRVGRGGAPAPERAGPLTGVLRDLVSDDPSVRPTAAEAQRTLNALSTVRRRPSINATGPQPVRPAAVHPGTAVQLGTVQRDPTLFFEQKPAPPTDFETAFAATPKPNHVKRLVIAGVAVLAVLALVLALTTGGGGPGEPTPATAPEPTPGASEPEAAGPITIPDPRVADPCSLLDPAALGAHGAVTLDDGAVPFAACRAMVTPPDGLPLAVSVEFQSAAQTAQASQEFEGAPEQVGPFTVARFAPVGPRCARRVLLPDGNVALFTTTGRGTDSAVSCAVADTGARAIVAALTAHGITPRPRSLTDGSVLAGIDACALITPEELAAVPGIDVTGRPGFGSWSCEWASGTGAYVRLAFAWRAPLTPEDGRGTDFAGRPGTTQLTAGSDCFAQFGQRTFAGPSGAPRIEAVQVFVYRSLPDAELCGAAATLASAAVGKLPPPA